MNYNFLNEFQFKNGATVKNRIVMAPMTTMSSFYNGMVTSDEIAYYAARAGGAGMVITGVANICPSGKGFEGELSVENDAMIPGLERLASAIKKDRTKAILQIFHAGRKTDSKILRGNQPVSASAVAAAYPPESEQPRELTNKEIDQIIADFGEATRRAIVAGFDGIELHGANTYLLQQFFSPHSNKRTDEWGGDRDKRMTFALRILAVVNETIKHYAKKEFILGYRISPEEIETPGIRLEDSLYFVERIKDQIDYLHLSMGSFQRTSLNNKEDSQTILSHFKEAAADAVPIIVVGSIDSPKQADKALSLGAAFAALGRAFIREPKWVQKVIANDEASLRTQLSPSDMDELAIPAGMQPYLTEFYKEVMNFTNTDTRKSDVSFSHRMAPMEGSQENNK